MYATIAETREEAEELYRRTLNAKEQMMLEDSMLGMDDTMCEYIALLLSPPANCMVGSYASLPVCL